MFGLYIIILIVVGYGYYIYGHRKGLKESNHVCKPNGPISAQPHQTVELKVARLACLECGELIPFNLSFQRSFKGRSKNQPYHVNMSYENYEMHMFAHHDKEPDKVE